jgi:hypothetical protein
VEGVFQLSLKKPPVNRVEVLGVPQLVEGDGDGHLKGACFRPFVMSELPGFSRDTEGLSKALEHI